MKTSGVFLDDEFKDVEAETLRDLFDKLARTYGKQDLDMDQDVKCYCSMGHHADGRVFWLPMKMHQPEMFEKFRDSLDAEFRTLIVHRGDRSPNSTPDSKPAGIHDLPDRLQNIEVTRSDSSKALPDRDPSRCVNEICPLSLEEVGDITDPLYIDFKQGNGTTLTLLCDCERFQMFVMSKIEEGKEITNVTLAHVQCRGEGGPRAFTLSLPVWTESILKNSKMLRHRFSDWFYCQLKRDKGLVELKKNTDLWSRILFWISDFYDFNHFDDGSKQRIAAPTSKKRCPFMTDFYFSEVEAKILGRRQMPSGFSLRNHLADLMQKRVDEHEQGRIEGRYEVCTSHEIAPVLVSCFGLKSFFEKHKYHNSDAFKSQKKKFVFQKGSSGWNEVRCAEYQVLDLEE